MLRGEVARLKMANDVLTKEMAKMKALVGAKATAAGGVDVDDLASRREVEGLRAELGKFKRQSGQVTGAGECEGCMWVGEGGGWGWEGSAAQRRDGAAARQLPAMNPRVTGA